MRRQIIILSLTTTVFVSNMAFAMDEDNKHNPHVVAKADSHREVANDDVGTQLLMHEEDCLRAIAVARFNLDNPEARTLLHMPKSGYVAKGYIAKADSSQQVSEDFEEKDEYQEDLRAIALAKLEIEKTARGRKLLSELSELDDHLAKASPFPRVVIKADFSREISEFFDGKDISPYAQETVQKSLELIYDPEDRQILIQIAKLAFPEPDYPRADFLSELINFLKENRQLRYIKLNKELLDFSSLLKENINEYHKIPPVSRLWEYKSLLYKRPLKQPSDPCTHQ